MCAVVTASGGILLWLRRVVHATSGLDPSDVSKLRGCKQLQLQQLSESDFDRGSMVRCSDAAAASVGWPGVALPKHHGWQAPGGWARGPGVTTQNVLRDVGVNYQ